MLQPTVITKIIELPIFYFEDDEYNSKLLLRRLEDRIIALKNNTIKKFKTKFIPLNDKDQISAIPSRLEYAIILVDMNFGLGKETDGLEILDEIQKKMGSNPKSIFIVIALTAYPDFKEIAYKKGVDAFFEKGYGIRENIRTITSIYEEFGQEIITAEFILNRIPSKDNITSLNRFLEERKKIIDRGFHDIDSEGKLSALREKVRQRTRIVIKSKLLERIKSEKEEILDREILYCFKKTLMAKKAGKDLWSSGTFMLNVEIKIDKDHESYLGTPRSKNEIAVTVNDSDIIEELYIGKDYDFPLKSPEEIEAVLDISVPKDIKLFSELAAVVNLSKFYLNGEIESKDLFRRFMFKLSSEKAWEEFARQLAIRAFKLEGSFQKASQRLQPLYKAYGIFPQVLDIQKGVVEEVNPEKKFILAKMKSIFNPTAKPNLRKFNLKQLTNLGIAVERDYFIYSAFKRGDSSFAHSIEIADPFM